MNVWKKIAWVTLALNMLASALGQKTQPRAWIFNYDRKPTNEEPVSKLARILPASAV